MRSFYEFYTAVRPGWPPLNVVTYNLLLLFSWVYALSRGGAPEKAGATIMVVGGLLTHAAASGAATVYQSVEVGIFVVDVLCAIAFVALALRADRFWTLWAAAFAIMGTVGHALRYFDPEMVRRTYAFMIVIWSYPIVLLIIAGTWRHRRRLAAFAADRSWSDWQR